MREGEEGNKRDLENTLKKYEEGEGSESPLHELGQRFINIGIMELYKYTEMNDLQLIGSLEAEEWSRLANEKKAELPPHLANQMIKYATENKIAKEISGKWKSSKREIDQNIMQMARYITEGIIDALEY